MSASQYGTFFHIFFLFFHRRVGLTNNIRRHFRIEKVLTYRRVVLTFQGVRTMRHNAVAADNDLYTSKKYSDFLQIKIFSDLVKKKTPSHLPGVSFSKKT